MYCTMEIDNINLKDQWKGIFLIIQKIFLKMNLQYTHHDYSPEKGLTGSS